MKILLVQTGWLGDMVLSTPVIAALKEIHPHSELWVLTTKQGKELVGRDPLVSGVITFDKRGQDAGVIGLVRKAAELRKANFKSVWSLHRSARTALVLTLAGIPQRTGFADAKLSLLYHNRIVRNMSAHEVIRKLALVNGSERAAEMRLFSPSTEEISEEIRLAAAGLKSYALLVPGSAWPTKMWNWSGYRQVAVDLLERGFSVVLAGSPDEQQVCDRVGRGLRVTDLCGKSSISDLIYLVGRADVVVCNDSFALHVASALKIPTVALFCATVPNFGFGPWRNRAVVLEVDGLSCRPCSRHGTRSCPTGTEHCMSGVGASEIVSAVTELLSHHQMEAGGG